MGGSRNGLARTLACAHRSQAMAQDIDAVFNLQPPKTIKELRSFVGAVMLNRDMFRRRLHHLKPLADQQAGKRNSDWTPACQKAFNAIKALLAKDAFIKHPDHNRPFHIQVTHN
jgi:hypothetical protein